MQPLLNTFSTVCAHALRLCTVLLNWAMMAILSSKIYNFFFLNLLKTFLWIMFFSCRYSGPIFALLTQLHQSTRGGHTLVTNTVWTSKVMKKVISTHFKLLKINSDDDDDDDVIIGGDDWSERSGQIKRRWNCVWIVATFVETSIFIFECCLACVLNVCLFLLFSDKKYWAKLNWKNWPKKKQNRRKATW